ncbi:hypothetical protein NUU61_000590 [Penicillium alfredii]|uniref:Uncharacterized protein n=1 Tax=Penicillium alfredii TaxID=1506179 RepID=A0A9W9GA28_9EURO|nr:uncharacterized protein NUU61_000590 [Penicillium alfredii]KAJ5114831.1 hypothetical protein NUU61_000590 [Penicillium alfredii]
MAHGDTYCPGDLDALHQDRNRSETTICLPSPSPIKRVSTYYPKAGTKVLEESNLDPFYLEQSLAATPTWGSYHPEIRHENFSHDNTQYYTLSLTTGNDLSYPDELSLPYSGPDRSTLGKLELENSRRFHRYTSSTEDQKPLHSSQNSFSSVETDSTTPDLTPSSSFSSVYSSPACPDAVLKATQQLYKHALEAHGQPRRRFYLPPSTPPKNCLPPLPPLPAGLSTPGDTRPTTPVAEPSNDSTTTITMRYTETASSCSSRRRKAHPTLNLSQGTSSHSSRRKQSSPGTRPPLDPSMISPPSLFNPVTMEPHATHFDQALFIPANDSASPAPSPIASSPPISRQWTATSVERPSTSTTEAYCEQSVWESDSDTESIGHKSLSRRPIDTLRKVRSRAKLRPAKSQPKLHQAMIDDQPTEKFPCMPDDAVGEPVLDPFRATSLDRPITTRDGTRPIGLQTLRLVAPSTTSLIRPRSRNDSSRNDSSLREQALDSSTAAAAQAKSRRRQRSDSPEYSNNPLHPPHKEKLTSLCHEQHSDATIVEAESESRPFFRRVMDSLRSLNCSKRPKATSNPI